MRYVPSDDAGGAENVDTYAVVFASILAITALGERAPCQRWEAPSVIKFW